MHLPHGFGAAVTALLSERQYQEAKWGDNLDKTNSIPDYVQYMENYLQVVKDNIKKGVGSVPEILSGIRKVTAIGVKVLEAFGAPQREGFPVDAKHAIEGIGNADQACNHTKACPACPMDERCSAPHCPDDRVTLKLHEEKPLSQEELDKMVQDEQEAVKIERGVYYRVNESMRVYHYDDGPVATKHCFEDIRAFAVMPSGGHRLLNAYGIWFYVQPGWRVLSVDGGIDGGVEVQ